MNNPITMFDYNADWALKTGSLDRRSGSGFLTREDVIQFFGTLGVDGVEIREDYWGDCSVQYLRQITQDAGLPIVSYVFTVDLAQPEAAKRRSAVDEARRLLDRTAELGAQIAMIFPGEIKEGYRIDQLTAWVIEGLAESATHAQSLGLTLAFENIDYEPWRPIYGMPEQCVEICRAVNSPNLRLICDACAALFVDQDPVEALKTMAPYLVHMHIKNSREVYPREKAIRTRDTNAGKHLTGTVLDGGLVPIPSILQELKRMNYTGRLLVEFQGENDPRPALQYNMDYLRRQMAAI